ncbi:hypothetical protein CVT25_009087 [Psilocybe cyanescens]|uniref:Ubiquitin-like domain-containing protein n=1 Tax=Psilocybe cyanescens TaxID=93625 RepID=A0A409VNF5_PSICY|nr:hypothetical protein CVT25_009087 [Psilocybe cyanescens]
MADETNPKIQLKITCNQQSITFSTRREKPLVKVFNAFSKRLGLDENTLRFYFDEQRVRPEQTPAELNMEDGEELDATVEQEGGKCPDISAIGC